MTTIANATSRAAGRWRTLNLAWTAFFLTFVVWFNLAPFKSTIGKQLGLTEAQLAVLLICNVALTIPARIAVGALVDRFGPRRVYTWLLVTATVPCVGCALAQEYWQLVICRLLVSCVGAGFVVGIRLVGEWFASDEIGLAEGVYGGLGNFGMAAATFALPLLAGAFGGDNGWRWAMAASGLACAAYAAVFHRFARDVPAGAAFRKPKAKGALEVCTRGDLLSLVFMQIPLVACLGVLVWRLEKVGLIAPAAGYVVYAVLAVVLAWQVRKIVRANAPAMRNDAAAVPDDERYSFAQVAILCVCYAVTFGGELAVESMLPAHFEKMFGVSVSVAGAMGAGFAVASLVARPLGGLLGDRVGRRPIMIVSLAGSAVGFAAIALIDAHWPLWAAMAVVIGAGFFLMAGNGANFCIAPLIRKPLTGQIAGLIGAYGNVGSVAFLFILSIGGVGPFFVSMIAVSVAAFACCFLIREPSATPAVATTRETATDALTPAPASAPAPIGGLLPEAV